MSKIISLSKLLLTWPQCPLSKEGCLEELKKEFQDLDIYIVCQEHHQDGNTHLHAFIKLNKARRIRWNDENRQLFDIQGYHADIEFLKSQKDVVRAIKYVTKDGDYISNGIDIKAVLDRETHNIHRRQYTTKTILESNIKDLVANDMISAREFCSILKAQQLWTLLNSANPNLDDCRGLWFWGVPGSGKSYMARQIGERLGGFYLKAQSKWWDGYQGEPVVILDDLDTAALSHHLKIWGDKYAFSAEVKGGTIPVPCKLVIVTSNYSPREIIERDNKRDYVDDQLVKAIERRFPQVYFEAAYDGTNGCSIEELLAARYPNKHMPTLEDDMQTPNMDAPVLVEVPQERWTGVTPEQELPQDSTTGGENTIILEGHTALNAPPDTHLSGHRE